MKKPCKGDSDRFRSYFVTTHAQLVNAPTSSSSPDAPPVRWASLLHPRLEETCQAAFETFVQSGLASSHVDLPLFDGQIWSTLLLECIPASADKEEVIKVTLKSASDKAQPNERSYRQRYKDLMRKMNLLMSSSQQMCWDWDLESDSLSLVGPQECILGYRYSDIPSGSEFWVERVHPADREDAQAALRQAIDGNKDTWDAEYRCKSVDKQYLWIKQFGVVTQRASSGQATHMLGTTQLIEERKQTENEKLQLLERYRAIAESQGDAVVRLGVDHRITYYNSIFARHFLDTQELDLELTLESAIQRYPNLSDFKAITGEDSKLRLRRSFITHSQSKKGQAIRHLWQATTIGNPLSGAQEIQLAGRDVSALKSLEEALVSSNRQNQAKDRFLAMISHDLKTPLNPILGFSEILTRRPNVDPSISEIARSINAAGQQLHEHINSLLEISKMDPEIYDQEFDNLCLNDLRNDFESTFALKAESKGITFLTSLSGPRDESFALDKKLLRNVLNNLIDNAIKFTAEGQVILLLSYQTCTQAGDDAKLHFKVIDEGPGIPSDSLKKVFEPFVRIDSSNSRETEGAGLGLSICQRALSILGGEIEAIPNPSHGMSFSGWIPLRCFQTGQRQQSQQSNDAGFCPPANTRTLIVDDIKSNREVLSEVLSELELPCESCADGHTALELIGKNPYDIVFLDIHMPKMNGIETFSRLHSLQSDRPRPYIVAVTADSTPQIKQSCTDCGIEDFITKPISRSKIKRVLGDFQKRQRRA
ncbi:response regulator [Pelagicoccus enzymogenes]|uniref:hybrid sensor histidine kinase/response regulator n=1 Tax=Pelagicoccus enzymogenes TaxID=2773457 RepID=UPI00280FA2F1|nr:response regulator [Pelagicoccus enzymogenes]MDQ8198856.1 response regulator [Pelagicoccus enzymogenes]